jgi:hypothetical protein
VKAMDNSLRASLTHKEAMADMNSVFIKRRANNIAVFIKKGTNETICFNKKGELTLKVSFLRFLNTLKKYKLIVLFLFSSRSIDIHKAACSC